MEYPPSVTTTITVPRGFRYSLVHVQPQGKKPTLFFLHGWPNWAYDFHHQIDHFRGQGYGILAPDLLGYGATDKPDDYREYRMKSMAEDMVAILDALNIDSAIGIGHDWGSALLSALAVYHPARISAYAFLAVGYSPPGRMQPERMNAMTQQHLGYAAFGYMQFFTEHDSAALLDRSAASTNALVFSDQDPQHWVKHMCPPGAARAWLEQGRTAPLPDWLDASYFEKRNNAFGRGGYAGPLNWYKQAVDAFNDEDAASIPEERIGIRDKPVLLVKDMGPAGAVPADMLEQMTRQACPDVLVREVDAGHWLMLEKSHEVNQVLAQFFSGEL